jgi:hypothetical protein
MKTQMISPPTCRGISAFNEFYRVRVHVNEDSKRNRAEGQIPARPKE